MTTACKAAHQRTLMPVIEKLSSEYEADGDNFRRMRTMCLREMNRFYNTIESAGMYLTDAEAKTVSESIENTLVLYGALAAEAQRMKKAKWSIVNKHHFLFHIGQQGRWLNPRLSWCYQSEDFMRLIGRIASTVMMGTGILNLSRKVVERWRIGRYSYGFANDRTTHST